MTSVRILWWVMGHVGYHFAFSIICFHVGKWSLQLLWQPYSRDRLQGSHIPLKFVFLWESSSSGHSGALWFKCFSPTREYLATIAPYQSILFAISIDPYHPLLPFTGPLNHIFISPSPPKASCLKKIPRFPWTLRFCQWLLKENPLDFSSATFAAYVAQLMREAGRAKVRPPIRDKTRPKGLGPQLDKKTHKFLGFTKYETDVFQFLIDSL